MISDFPKATWQVSEELGLNSKLVSLHKHVLHMLKLLNTGMRNGLCGYSGRNNGF